jgi:hypothetical protein
VNMAGLYRGGGIIFGCLRYNPIQCCLTKSCRKNGEKSPHTKMTRNDDLEENALTVFVLTQGQLSAPLQPGTSPDLLKSMLAY